MSDLDSLKRSVTNTVDRARKSGPDTRGTGTVSRTNAPPKGLKARLDRAVAEQEAVCADLQRQLHTHRSTRRHLEKRMRRSLGRIELIKQEVGLAGTAVTFERQRRALLVKREQDQQGVLDRLVSVRGRVRHRFLEVEQTMERLVRGSGK